MVNPNNICRVCDKKTRNFQFYILCAVCQTKYHYQCLTLNRKEYHYITQESYFCHYCLALELPFLHIDDDFDFIDTLAEYWYEITRLDTQMYQDKCFQPFEINESNHASHFSDIDPDFNFFNSLAGNTYSTCDYFLEDSFINLKNQYNLKNLFSLIHFNARSLNDSTMENIEVFNSSIGMQFKIMAISETWMTKNRIDFANFDTYSSVHNYRADKVGGGVSLYVHQSLNFKQHTDFFLGTSCIENCFIESDKSFSTK